MTFKAVVLTNQTSKQYVTTHGMATPLMAFKQAMESEVWKLWTNNDMEMPDIDFHLSEPRKVYDRKASSGRQTIVYIYPSHEDGLIQRSAQVYCAGGDFLGTFWKRKYESMLDRVADLGGELRQANLMVENEYKRGFSDGEKSAQGKEDKMAMVMLDTDHKKHSHYPVGTLEFWRDMFVLQTRKINGLTSQTRDSLNLVIAIADSSPLADTSRIELIKKLAVQSGKIAMLESELEEAYAVDYSAIVRLAIETGIDSALARANLAQSLALVEAIKELANDI